MRENLGEVALEFFKVDIPAPILVHERKAELVLFSFCSVAKNIHNLQVLIKRKHPVLVDIENLENAISQKGVLLLPQNAHLVSELKLIHNICSLLDHFPGLVPFFKSLSLGLFVEHFTLLFDRARRKPCLRKLLWVKFEFIWRKVNWDLLFGCQFELDCKRLGPFVGVRVYHQLRSTAA